MILCIFFFQQAHSSASGVWNKFYGHNNEENVQYTRKPPPPNSEYNYFSIHQVLFMNFNSIVINLNNNNKNAKLLVSYCSFDSNKANETDSTNILQNSGHCVQYRTCSFNTYNEAGYPHSKLESGNNSIIESTLNRCKGYNGPIYLKTKSIVKYTNISTSIAISKSVYHIERNGIVSYSTFFNNSAAETYCLFHLTDTVNINNSNIISNKCSLSTKNNAVVYAAAHTKVNIYHCIIFKNSGNSTFNAEDNAEIFGLDNKLSQDVIIGSHVNINTEKIYSDPVNTKNLVTQLCLKVYNFVPTATRNKYPRIFKRR